MAKIIVVDNHSVFRMGLLSVLQGDPRFQVEGEYRSFTAVKPILDLHHHYILLVDVSVNKEAGFDVPQYLKVTFPGLKVIIFSFYKDDFYVFSAVEAGIDGYIHKDAEPEEIKLGIAKVIEGEKFYSREISNILVQNLQKKNYRGLPFLTTREKVIIKYIMEGHSSKQIASFLEVSPRTIDTHRANILGKFNLKNTTELVSKIAENKILL